DLYVRRTEQEKLKALREKLKQQQQHLKELDEHMYVDQYLVWVDSDEISVRSSSVIKKERARSNHRDEYSLRSEKLCYVPLRESKYLRSNCKMHHGSRIKRGLRSPGTCPLSFQPLIDF